MIYEVFHLQIGNAYINDETDLAGILEYYWTHALISDEVHMGITLNCNFTVGANISDTCGTYLDQINTDGIFPYDIYAPWCGSSIGSPSVCFFYKLLFFANLQILYSLCLIILIHYYADIKI